MKCDKCKKEVEELWTAYVGIYMEIAKDLWYCEDCWNKLKKKVDKE